MSSREPHVCVVAFGASTPVGRSAATSAAAVRAGISALCSHPTMVDMAGDPFMVAMDLELGLGDRPGRMFELARRALSEVLAQLPIDGRIVPVLLGLPESAKGLTDDQGVAFCRRLELEFAERRLAVEPILEGNASGMLALERAGTWLQSRRDGLCIVGGVDSFIDPDVLESLDRSGRIASASRRWGFAPGEGAGMLGLCGADFASRNRLSVYGRIASVANGFEPNKAGTETICLGHGLADVMRRVALAVKGPISTQYCDMNGERYREHEYSYAVLRMPQGAFVNAVDYVAPVDCWGHVGAASAVLLMTLPLALGARGAAPGAFPMVWCGSDGGARGAAVLQFERGR